jgi:RND superfamily putative drug exporter
MAIVGSRLWYHPQWFARHIPDPDIEGQRLEHEHTGGELAAAGTSVRPG